MMVGFERLSGLDESFLGFETRNAPMHVAVTGIFERGPLGRARGSIDLNGELLEEGDGAAVSDESDLAFAGKGPDAAEFLLFDLA